MQSDPTAPQTTGAVPRFARIDVIGGSVMVGLAALIWYGAIGLSVGQVINFGPGAMPRVLAALLFLAGGAVLLRGLLQPDDEATPLTLALRPPLLVATAIFLFALFIRGGQFWFADTPRLGLTVVGPLTVFIAGLATPLADPRELLVMAFGLTAAIMLVFADLLGVPLPVFPAVIDRAIPPAFGGEAALRLACAVYGAIAAGFYVLFFGIPGAGK